MTEGKSFKNNIRAMFSITEKGNKKGFTLIELVVVIAIMAILVLIMVPNLTAYVEAADEKRVHADLKNAHTAAEMVRQTGGPSLVQPDDSFSDAEFKKEVAKLTNIDFFSDDVYWEFNFSWKNDDGLLVHHKGPKYHRTFNGLKFTKKLSVWDD